MTREPLPDNITKLANTLRDRAGNEPDLDVKRSLLESAEKLDSVDKKARRVFGESDALKDELRKRHAIGWMFWVFIAGLVGAFLFRFLFL